MLRNNLDYKHASSINPSGNFRILLISLLAAVIGLLAGFVAFGLYSLISIITNLVFFQRFGFTLPSLKNNPLGLWIIIVPVIGGLIVGVMAKYGSSKIKGHGIPEAMEAVLTNRISGDLLINQIIRQWGGLFNEVAILLFLGMTIYSTIKGAKK
jgi:H+/Cl- antiporter ClcA